MSELIVRSAPVYKPLDTPARYYGIYGGRGSGKSHEVATRIVTLMVCDKNLSVVCLREIQKSLKFSVKRLIENKISDMGVSSYFEIQNEQIKRVGGTGIIIFQGMQDHTSDSIKSLEGFKLAWFEEAQTASQRSLDLLRPTIRSPGSSLWFTWNPRNSTDPIEQLLRCETPPPGSVVIEANFKDNPWFPEELQAEMEYDRSRDPDKYAHIWLGRYQVNSSLRVFKNWAIEEFEKDKAAMMRQGADWGFSVDPTVLIQCYIEGRKLYATHEAYQVGCEIIDTPDLFMTVPDAEKWPIIADSARPETISHMRKHGFPKILPAIKGPGSIEDGIEWLKSFDIIVHPSCVHLIDELSLFSYKPHPDTGEPTNQLQDKKNHVIDALRYACEGARRAVKKPREKKANSSSRVNNWMAN